MPSVIRSRAVEEVAEIGEGRVRVAEGGVGADPVGIGVVPRLARPGEAEAGEIAERRVEIRAERSALRARDQRCDEVHRRLAQDAGRLAMRIALEAATGWIVGRRFEAGEASRPRRGPCRVPVVAGQEGEPMTDRRIEGGRVQPGHLALVPTATGEPGVLHPGRRRGGQARDDLGAVDRVVERDRAPRARQAHEVDVEVMEAGDDRGIAGVDDARARCGRIGHVGSRPRGDHPAAGDADRLHGVQPIGLGRDDDLPRDHELGARPVHRSGSTVKRGVWTNPAGSGPNAIRTSTTGTTTSQ